MATLRRRLTLVTIILFVSVITMPSRIVLGASQNTIVFTKTWGGTEWDSAQSVVIDHSGSILVAGSTASFGNRHSHILLLKYGPSGKLLWQKTWGGTQDDYGSSVAVDTNDNIYVAGSTYSFGAGKTDVVLLKFDSIGSLLWQRVWGGSGEDWAGSYEAAGRSLTVDTAGNIYVTGSTASFGAGREDAFLLRFNSAGSLIWQRTWGGNSADFGYGVGVDSSGNIFLMGWTLSFGDTIFLLKFNSTGSLQWQRTCGCLSNYGHGFAIDPKGNIYVGGNLFRSAGFDADFLILKFDSSGTMTWARTWGGGAADFLYGISVDAAGNVYAVGYTDSFPVVLGTRSAVLLKFDPSGGLISQMIWGGSDDTIAFDVALDSSGNPYIAGEVYSGPPYSISYSGNRTLVSPTISIGSTGNTTATPAFTLGTPLGVIDNPSGSEKYAGYVDAFITMGVSIAPEEPFPSVLVILVVTPIFILGRRNNRA